MSVHLAQLSMTPYMQQACASCSFMCGHTVLPTVLSCLVGFLPLQQPYYSPWVNHIRAGLYAMTAWVALMLTANVWAEQDAQEAGLTGDVLSTAVWAAKSAQLSLLATAVMPAALVFGMVVSWLRLHLANRAALPKFRCVRDAASLCLLQTGVCVEGIRSVHCFSQCNGPDSTTAGGSIRCLGLY